MFAPRPLPHAHHYSTRGGAEIDLILEGALGLLPVEIKLTSRNRIEADNVGHESSQPAPPLHHLATIIR